MSSEKKKRALIATLRRARPFVLGSVRYLLLLSAVQNSLHRTAPRPPTTMRPLCRLRAAAAVQEEQTQKHSSGKHSGILLCHSENGILRFSMRTWLLPLSAVQDVMPSQDGNHPHGGSCPGQRDHDQGALLGPASEVAQRRSDGPVAVEREDEEVEDGGRRGRVVHGQPELADDVAETPVSCGGGGGKGGRESRE